MCDAKNTPIHMFVRPCRSSCEECVGCRQCGTCGSAFGNNQRVNIIGCAVVFSVIAICLQLMAVMAYGTDINTVKDLGWVEGTADGVTPEAGAVEAGVEFFIGLNSVVLCTDDVCKNHNFEDCKHSGFSPHEWCSDCDRATGEADDLVVLAIVLSFVQLFSEMTRFTEKSDLNCSKVFATFTSLFTCIILIAALGFFEEGCTAHLPAHMIYKSQTFTVDWNIGSGSWCALICVFLKIYGVFAAVIVPTPAHMHSEDYSMNDEPGKAKPLMGIDLHLNQQQIENQRQIVAKINREKKEATMKKHNEINEKDLGGGSKNHLTADDVVHVDEDLIPLRGDSQL